MTASGSLMSPYAFMTIYVGMSPPLNIIVNMTNSTMTVRYLVFLLMT